MHDVSNRARTARFRRVAGAVFAGLAITGALAGCAGEDLAKANFQRTTVPPDPGSGGSGPVPTGPINDPAVAAETLRTVDPCPLLSDGALGSLGAPGDRMPSGITRCRAEVRDAGGKTVKVSLELGGFLIGSADDANGGVEGLPQIEKKQDDTHCSVAALTSKEPVIGIEVSVDYPGGEPCRPGRTVLQQVVKDLHGSPTKFPEAKGSLIPVDPCTTVDDGVIAEVIPGEVRKQATGLRGCDWKERGPNVTVEFRSAYAPTAGSDGEQVDLGEGRVGFQKQASGGQECTVKWQHRATGEDGDDEVVVVGYLNYGTEGADDPCGRSLKVAQNVAAKLPKP